MFYFCFIYLFTVGGSFITLAYGENDFWATEELSVAVVATGQNWKHQVKVLNDTFMVRSASLIYNRQAKSHPFLGAVKNLNDKI